MNTIRPTQPKFSNPRPLPSKNSSSHVGEFGLVGKFAGYQARLDPTTVGSNWLVSPSQNVLINTSGRISFTKGYALDGAGSTVIDSGILSNFDFTNFRGSTRNMRAGFLTSAANDGKLQFRYGPTSTWYDLVTALTTVRLSFCEYWDTTNLVKLLLWVDGSNFINAWNGAVTTLASASAATGYISVIAAAPVAGGVGYTVGDVLTITAGTATATVTAVSAGVVTAVALTSTGSGYTTGTKATTGGTGTGATLSVTTVVNNSITNQGTLTWAQHGFNQSAASIIINGTTYTYTNIIGNTMIGIGSDPTVPGYAVGTVIAQSPIKTALSAMTAILATFAPTVIGCGRRNQVYVGSSTSNNLYISKVNNYLDYTVTTPVRAVGDGALIPLDSAPTRFIPLESQDITSAKDMYISEGKDTWAVIRATLSSDLSKETLEHIRMQVAPLQGAFSERMVTKMKNHIVFLANDKTANFMGYLSSQNIPEIADFSHSIIDDMNSYDPTDGSAFYYKNYILVSIPKSGIIRIYNMTDQTQSNNDSLRNESVDQNSQKNWFWESPITFPLSGFYVVNGELYGHSYTTSESYKLFTGGSLNGQQIDYNVTMGFDDKGDRTQGKTSTKLYVEGYIKQNTTINGIISADLNSFQSSQVTTINGNDNTIVAYGSGAHALGKNNLGSEPLGGALTITTTLPAWFHVIKTYPQIATYLEQLSFTAKGVDLQCEFITFGTNALMTPEGNNQYTQ